MKKILLIIFTIILILSINVLAVDIDIGMPAIGRSYYMGNNITLVIKDNPADATGKITTVEIWSYTDLANVEVATFYVVSGNNLSTRDTEYIGTVTSGAKRTFSVDLDVQTGDYLGIYLVDGDYIEKDNVGYTGIWYKAGDQISCADTAFSFQTDSTISLYGTGATAVGWDHKWNTQIISKWNTKEIVKWNGLE
ncbi:hypothetical protein ES705_02888 [subsurface metagenome]